MSTEVLPIFVQSFLWKNATKNRGKILSALQAEIKNLSQPRLLRGSFRPSNDIIELRSYVRQRSRLFDLAGTQVQLMHKALTQMNIQLNHAISDITGVTGQNIIRAILKGERDPKTLANLSVKGCRKNIEKIEKALEGHFRKEHLFALNQAYEAYEFFHKQIQTCEECIQKMLIFLEIKPSSHAKDNSKFPKQAYRKKPLHAEARIRLMPLPQSKR